MIELHIFFLLIVKHTIVDLGIQSWLLWGKAHEKGDYLGGHQHYLHHAIGTFLVLLCFLDLHTTCVLSVIDYLAHWHIDFSKHNLNRYLNVTRKDLKWWWITVLDQLLHFTTYYLIMIYVSSLNI